MPHFCIILKSPLLILPQNNRTVYTECPIIIHSEYYEHYTRLQGQYIVGLYKHGQSTCSNTWSPVQTRPSYRCRCPSAYPATFHMPTKRDTQYWVTHKLSQKYTLNHATFPIRVRKMTVQICGNFWVTRYVLQGPSIRSVSIIRIR